MSVAVITDISYFDIQMRLVEMKMKMEMKREMKF